VGLVVRDGLADGTGEGRPDGEDGTALLGEGAGVGLAAGTGIGCETQRGNVPLLSTAGDVTDSTRLPFASTENVSTRNSTDPFGMAAG